MSKRLYGENSPEEHAYMEAKGQREPRHREGEVGLCIVCGENWCLPSICTRCQRSMEQDKLERESGR